MGQTDFDVWYYVSIGELCSCHSEIRGNVIEGAKKICYLQPSRRLLL